MFWSVLALAGIAVLARTPMLGLRASEPKPSVTAKIVPPKPPEEKPPTRSPEQEIAQVLDEIVKDLPKEPPEKPLPDPKLSDVFDELLKDLPKEPPAKPPPPKEEKVREPPKEPVPAPAPKVPPKLDSPRPRGEVVPELKEASKKKSGLFICIDIEGGLPALLARGFRPAVADADNYVTHIIDLDAGPAISGIREFDRADRAVFADVMFRVPDVESVDGLAALSRSVRQKLPNASVKLLILRGVYNNEIAPLLKEARSFAAARRLAFDGVRLVIRAGSAAIEWDGIYADGMFYRR